MKDSLPFKLPFRSVPTSEHAFLDIATRPASEKALEQAGFRPVSKGHGLWVCGQFTAYRCAEYNGFFVCPGVPPESYRFRLEAGCPRRPFTELDLEDFNNQTE